MGQVTRRVLEMNRDQLGEQIRVARRLFVKIFLMAAGYMVVFAVLMALVGRVARTVGLVAARPDKTAIDPPILALALFGAAVVSAVAGIILCLRAVFDRRFQEASRMDPSNTADVERKVDGLLSAALPGLDGAPYKNVRGAGRRRRSLAWAGRLLILAVLLIAAVIYIFISY